MVQLRWLKEAKDDLREIYAYISSEQRRYNIVAPNFAVYNAEPLIFGIITSWSGSEQ